MNTRTKVILLSISVLALSSYFWLKGGSKESQLDEKIVEVSPVKRETIRETADLIGTIRSHKQTLLTAKSSGNLTLFVRAGEKVKRGELLACIDNPDLERNYNIIKETESIAKAQYDRLHSLLKTGVSSKSSVEEQRAIFLEAQKKLTDAKMALDDLKIYAPFDGIVGFFKLRDGSQVNKGDIIVNFYDPQSLFVEFDLPLRIAKQVHDGAPVWVNKAAYKLTHIQKMLDEDTHMCPAYANFRCPQCIIGTTTDVTVATQERTNALVIPFEAVFLRNGNPFVYVVKDNKCALTPVQLGLRDKTRVEILKGLQENDPLIVIGHARLYPDAPVKVHAQG